MAHNTPNFWYVPIGYIKNTLTDSITVQGNGASKDPIHCNNHILTARLFNGFLKRCYSLLINLASENWKDRAPGYVTFGIPNTNVTVRSWSNIEDAVSRLPNTNDDRPSALPLRWELPCLGNLPFPLPISWANSNWLTHLRICNTITIITLYAKAESLSYTPWKRLQQWSRGRIPLLCAVAPLVNFPAMSTPICLVTLIKISQNSENQTKPPTTVSRHSLLQNTVFWTVALSRVSTTYQIKVSRRRSYGRSLWPFFSFAYAVTGLETWAVKT